jgi:hypothetical protein
LPRQSWHPVDHLTAHRASFNGGNKVTLWHAVKAVKRLLTWGWRQERVDALPRNLDEYAKVERPKPAPKFFTADEVKANLLDER